LPALLLLAFRQQNVSLNFVGGWHTWIYDFYSVENLLKQAGIENIQRTSANTSNFQDIPFEPLDMMMECQKWMLNQCTLKR